MKQGDVIKLWDIEGLSCFYFVCYDKNLERFFLISSFGEVCFSFSKNEKPTILSKARIVGEGLSCFSEKTNTGKTFSSSSKKILFSSKENKGEWRDRFYCKICNFSSSETKNVCPACGEKNSFFAYIERPVYKKINCFWKALGVVPDIERWERRGE